MTQDLTKITTPLGLLDEVHGPGTEDRLKAWAHGWEAFIGKSGWAPCVNPAWNKVSTYRAKPAPREYVAWQVCWHDGEQYAIYTEKSKSAADRMAVNLGGFVVKLTGTRDE